MKKNTLIFLFIFYKVFIAQSFTLLNSDTINVVDIAGKKQGKWIITNAIAHLPCYADDQKVEEGKYIDSKKTGPWKEYYCNNNIKSKINYENNRPSGYTIIYHENGKIKEEGTWKNNRWVGNYKLYFENGEVHQSFNFDAAGKRSGNQQYFYENGQLMIEGDWAEGKEAGVLKEYYENGELRSEKDFSGGVLNVATEKIYEPKKPITAIPIVEEHVDAPPAPVIKNKTEKDNLGKGFTGEGYWQLYNLNKQITKDGVFKKSRLMDGKAYFYNSDGILTRIAVYKDGKYTGDSIIEE